SFNEFDTETLESKITEGLYCTGELLDVDAPCGGFNLQWAWASGIVAGTAAAYSLTR
ncbi:MAG: NAD(P)/FAD-dependent oxidoreductase, partial [Acutalibacteraceae bacterium]|nr:NAD(P)/FAD-dependent oxidoreductase [Acutalibacteraceae bacterium]